MDHSLRKYLQIIEPQKIYYFRKKILLWYDSNKRSFPWRRTKNPYYILVAEILLQQTDASKVSKEYSSFIKLFPSPKNLANAKITTVRKFISRLGLNYRASRLIDICKILEYNFNCTVPSKKEELLQLPGVGPYIANAVLASAYKKRVAVLDTNVIRIIERFFGIKSSMSRPRTDPSLWSFANQLLPRSADISKKWNYALLDFAALVCTFYCPNCDSCTLRRCCNYFSNMCPN